MFKKFLSLFLSMCIVSCFVNINLFVPSVCAEELTEEEQAEINLIPDPNLRAALRETLQKSEGEYITDSDLEGLETLEATNRNIKILTGLEKCKSLKELVLPQNQIVEVPDLSRLTKLEELNLNYNQISNITVLKKLTQLKKLEITGNSIRDMSPLKDLITSLERFIAVAQEIELEPFTVEDESVSLPTNIVIGFNGTPINPSTDGTYMDAPDRKLTEFYDIYPEGGTYDEENNLITWTGLSGATEVSYSYGNDFLVSAPYDYAGFSGRVYRKALKKNYNIGDRTYVKLNKGGITWLKEESDGSSAWYGLENPEIAEGEYLFPDNSYFYVEWVSPNDFETNEHYAVLDDSVKSDVEDSRGRLFYVGIADETGQKMDINFNGHTADLYVQIGDEWQPEDLNSVFVKDSEDETVNVTFAKDVEYPEGTGNFGVMSLRHFSPHFIYDNDTALEGETVKRPSNNHSSSSNSQEILDPDTEENLPIENEKEDKSSDSFEDDLTNVFVTGDSQTHIIAWSAIGIVLLALGILSLVLKSKKLN